LDFRKRGHAVRAGDLSPFSILNSQFQPAAGFTLVELLVVIAVIGLILGLILPGVSAMWNQRLEAQAETVAAGALRSVQMQARHNGERGLFFYLEDGVQKIAMIQSTPAVQNASPPPAQITALNVIVDCFEVVSGFDQRMPPPYRAAPRTVVLNGSALPATQLWEDGELNNEDYTKARGTGNQRQRNFFSVIFGPDGRLIAGRNVLVYDPKGLTGLATGSTSTYYDVDGVPQDFPPPSAGTSTPSVLSSLVLDRGGAINFPGVDGLLVYDDSLFQELVGATAAETATLRRQWLTMNGRPYYVSRLTGSVIRGPVGE
jgi:prepilin-type N-terminal cleavage/methylation domain-containing protein